uniref:Uncharacterized protein AlNc14C114G6466 n=1 Tax=Albugo laibachii Nc14 TaxID=890382 RepID=F0WIT1_9STRA|nr:conserved hypothetical protein [Albugo laibachii Nc14]|eukprot:CCA21175.1 conserved hypothetical protein [Albugo laibachii Nc14]
MQPHSIPTTMSQSPRNEITLCDPNSKTKTLNDLKNTCITLRHLLTDIQTAKETKGDAFITSNEFHNQKRQAFLFLGAMKGRLRDTFLEKHNKKMEIQKKKEFIDVYHLKLQNLLYEKQHLLCEIDRHGNTSLTEMNKIEFKPALEINVNPDTHKQHLNRLVAELESRKQMQNDFKALDDEIAQVESITKQKLKFLANLRGTLNVIEDSTQSLQEYMGNPVTSKLRKQNEAIELLPTPLYSLYCELDGYMEAAQVRAERMQVEVVATDFFGQSTKRYLSKRKFSSVLSDPKDPPQKRIRSASPRTPSRSPSSSRATTLQRSIEVDSTVETEASNAEDLVDHVNDKNECSTEVEDENVGDLNTHSLLLKLCPVKETFSILFRYCKVFKIVTVEVVESSSSKSISHEAILMNLFPNDDGNDIPRIASGYEFIEVEGMDRVASLLGRPYHWAQWICGLHVLPRPKLEDRVVVSDTLVSRIQPSIQNTMHQLVKRFSAAAYLELHLSKLERASLEKDAVRVAPDSIEYFPSFSPKTRLEAWTLMVPEGGKSLSSRVYLAAFKNGDTRCEATVEISTEFPVRAPHFRFCTDKSSLQPTELKEVEMEVNDHCMECIKMKGEVEAEAWILMHQLRKIQYCIDILVSSIEKTSGKESDPTQVWIKRILSATRHRRGKNRRLPFGSIVLSQCEELLHR